LRESEVRGTGVDSRAAVSYDKPSVGAVNIPAVVNICATAEKQVLDGLEVLRSLVSRLEDNKFRGTVVQGLLPLGLG
jgi:hypothetical protein